MLEYQSRPLFLIRIFFLQVDLKEESSDKIVDENKNIEDFTVSDTKHSPKKRKIDDKVKLVGDSSQVVCFSQHSFLKLYLDLEMVLSKVLITIGSCLS